MKTLKEELRFVVIGVIVLLGSLLLVELAFSQRNQQVQVCHKDRKTGKLQTLTLAQSAADKHLQHGDTLGACPTTPPPPNDNPPPIDNPPPVNPPNEPPVLEEPPTFKPTPNTFVSEPPVNGSPYQDKTCLLYPIEDPLDVEGDVVEVNFLSVTNLTQKPATCQLRLYNEDSVLNKGAFELKRFSSVKFQVPVGYSGVGMVDCVDSMHIAGQLTTFQFGFGTTSREALECQKK